MSVKQNLKESFTSKWISPQLASQPTQKLFPCFHVKDIEARDWFHFKVNIAAAMLNTSVLVFVTMCSLIEHNQ